MTYIDAVVAPRAMMVTGICLRGSTTTGDGACTLASAELFVRQLS